VTATAKQTLTIANGETTSGAVVAGGYAAYGLQLPAAFTGTALTFTVSADGGATYQTLYDINNVAVAMTVAQGRSYDLPPELGPWPSWKIVSGSAEGAARTLWVVGKSG
jgi:hypothetical protein